MIRNIINAMIVIINLRTKVATNIFIENHIIAPINAQNAINPRISIRAYYFLVLFSFSVFTLLS